MKTLLITGGTDGIGRAVARTYLERGDQVIIAGATAGKGMEFVEAARASGAGDRAWFMQADLSLTEENKKIIDFLGSRFPALQAGPSRAAGPVGRGPDRHPRRAADGGPAVPGTAAPGRRGSSRGANRG